ncbi:hypothetical protein VF13_37850 [Nostoc linckia z16]|nr:hypothetical protein VF13_37850 [Nostoc linckia z16]
MEVQPKQAVNKVKKNLTIKRYIHYYELLIGYQREYERDLKDSFMKLLKAVIDENNSRSRNSFFVYDGRTFCIQGLTIRDAEKIAFGKLCAIRSEDFPQVFNLRNGSTRNFDAEDFEGLVEFTHFVINYKPKYERIAIEYNQYGGKILDFVRYLEHIGKVSGIVTGMTQKNIVNENLAEVKDKIGRVSKFTVKANSSHIESIRAVDAGLGTVLDQAKNHYNLQDIQVELKFDYSRSNTKEAIYKTLDTIVKAFTKNPQKTDLFLKLQVDAENTERDNKIQAFDLLMDKVRSELKATKDGKNRTLISNELLQNMIVEMKKLNL